MRDTRTHIQCAPGFQASANDSEHAGGVGHHNLNCNNVLVSVSGYYGYHRLVGTQQETQMDTEMDTTNCDMDIQFNNYIEPEVQQLQNHRSENRTASLQKKRQWEVLQGDDLFYICKKRRENGLFDFYNVNFSIVF